jgi:hypothetical protein
MWSFQPRPRYYSEINLWSGKYEIKGEIPEVVRLNDDPRPELYGGILALLVRDILEGTRTDPQILQYVREGRYTFLFGEDGKFLAH